MFGLPLRKKVLSMCHQLSPTVNLGGGFLSVGIIGLLNAIILQFVTLKYFERRMILW